MTQLSLTEATQFMNELFAIWTETDHASRRAATRIDVEFRYLGPLEDPETVELELLARLQRLGYQVDRRAPKDEPKG